MTNEALLAFQLLYSMHESKEKDVLASQLPFSWTMANKRNGSTKTHEGNSNHGMESFPGVTCRCQHYASRLPHHHVSTPAPFSQANRERTMHEAHSSSN